VGSLHASDDQKDKVVALLKDVCTGRGSRTRALLAARGYEEVPEFKINIGISYTSALCVTSAGALEPHRVLVVLPKPPHKRGVFVAPVENGH
jgi:hypothetical protein